MKQAQKLLKKYAEIFLSGEENLIEIKNEISNKLKLSLMKYIVFIDDIDRLNNKEIRLEDVINKYNISIRTFRRYISEINIYLANNYKNQSVVYDYYKKTYYLK